MKRLHVAAAARRDLTEAMTHIALENPDAALRLRNRLFEAASQLAAFLALGPADDQGRRVFSVPRSQFRLIYRVDANRVTLLRIWHGARGWPPTLD